MKSATKTPATEQVTCKWETAANKSCRRLVREWWVGDRVVKFVVVTTEQFWTVAS